MNLPEGTSPWDLLVHLLPEDIADEVVHALNRSPRINISEIIIEPTGRMLGDIKF